MAPSAMSSFPGPGPSSTRTRTASGSQRPAPAASVSARCRSVESGSPPRTAATPPCAQRVVACWSSAFVSTPTCMLCSSAARTAAESPATPEPSTSRSRPAGTDDVYPPPSRGRQLVGLLDVDVPVGGGALLLGGDQLGGDRVDR